MSHIAKFKQDVSCKMILRDSYKENAFYGLDDFDCKYLKIVQSKFGCMNSFHTIPDRVKMELAPFEWNDKKQEYVLADRKWQVVQLNQLENLVISHSKSYDDLLLSF